MHHFQYRNGELHAEEVPVSRIEQGAGTPFYLYSHATLLQHFRAFDGAFEGIPHLVCFSMKSNSSQAVLRLFSNEGGGADIVSGGELYRALAAGVDPKRIVYSGVGKTPEEMSYAIRSGILLFAAESPQEIARLNEVAGAAGARAPIAIRVNPDIDPKTHPYISTGMRENKFGIPMDQAFEEYIRAAGMHHLDVCGVSCHIGSQLTRISPFVEALGRLKDLIGRLAGEGIRIRYLDLGGGLGITYDRETPPAPKEYAGAIKKELDTDDMLLLLEPGRVITGNAGILVTRVLYTKATEAKTFIVVDAAMNDLIRPSLYGSFHRIQPVLQCEGQRVKADVVGPICESGDFLAKDRDLEPYEPGDLMAVMSAGAYGFSMSSSYNSRPRAAEVMVRNDRFEIIRERESYKDLIRGERIPDLLS
ncbi:MAG: diaminopimelate decarboxylase [Thermodesulfobacteriota bacterium]